MLKWTIIDDELDDNDIDVIDGDEIEEGAVVEVTLVLDEFDEVIVPVMIDAMPLVIEVDDDEVIVVDALENDVNE
jgi:hypothetical protein